MSENNGFVFVSGGGRRKNDLGEKQEKKPNAIGNITNVPGDLKNAVENMKRQKEANQQQAALN